MAASEKFVASCAMATVTLDVSRAVDALLGLAYSVKHCREKCKALADKVKDIHDCALRSIQQQRSHFEEEGSETALAKFEQVVKDATDLVLRYKNRSILTKILLTLKLEDDFTSVDARLDDCMKLFDFSLQVRNTLTLAHLQESQSTFSQEAREMFAKYMETPVQDMKRFTGHLPSDCAASAELCCKDPLMVVHSEEELYGGFMVTGKMQLEGQEHLLDVLLIASAQLDPNQVAIMKRLSFHANVLQFFGKHVADGGCLYAVMERPGSTSGRIMTLDIFISMNPALYCDWRLKKMIALELALAIAYAHSAQVLHRALRSPNIFLTDDFHPKVFGFFQGRIKTEPSERRFSSQEQFRWAAPEMLQKRRPDYNEQCDIFSFGVIMWELIAWSYPYSDCLKQLDVITARTKQGRKLEFPYPVDSCSESLKEFLNICLECMELDPGSRPSIHSIVDRISKLAPEGMHMAPKVAQEGMVKME